MPDHCVLHLLGPSTGGIRQHVAELVRQLNTRSWPSSVAGPDAVMSGLLEQVSVVAVPASWNPFELVRARRMLRSVIKGVSIVHAHGLKAAVVALSLGHRRPPIVLTLHNMVEGTHSGRSARLLAHAQRGIIARVDHLIVLSAESLDQVGSLLSPQRQTLVMPLAPRPNPQRTPEEVRQAYGIAPDAPFVVMAARHHPQKDVPMFLRAFATARTSLPDARALIAGDGPERPTIERIRSSLGLDDAVVIAGHQANPADALAAADVVAVSSRWEAGPLVSVECLQLGRPLVTTAVGSVSEQLVDGIHARIMPIGDSDAFARALVEVLTDREAANAMADAGQRLASSVFDPDVLVGPVIDAYEATLRAASSGSLRATRSTR